MIDIPGQRLLNASPPSVALLATTAFQLGLVVLLRDRAERWLHRTRPWQIVVALNAVVFTIFLWHLTAVVLLAGLLHALHLLPTPTVATTGWWLWRLPWLVLLIAVLGVLVAIFGRFETRSRQRPTAGSYPGGHAAAAVVTVASYAGVVTGLLANNLAPNMGDYVVGMPAAGLAVYLLGAGVLRLLRDPRLRPSGAHGSAGP